MKYYEVTHSQTEDVYGNEEHIAIILRDIAGDGSGKIIIDFDCPTMPLESPTWKLAKDIADFLNSRLPNGGHIPKTSHE